MKKALTGPDIGQLVKGWQSLIGSRVDQFGRPDLNKVILNLSYFIMTLILNFFSIYLL